MKLKYFKRSEFNCKCGCNTNIIDDEFLLAMDNARRISGVPYRINSGYKKNPQNQRYESGNCNYR